jgi:ribonuclease HI
MITIFCDGSCNNSKTNAGSRKGGWGAILQYKGKEKRISGSASDTSSSRMEMMAALMALCALKRHDLEIQLNSDSQYLIKGMNEWSANWVKRKWKNSNGDTVANKDLWLQLLDWNKKLKIKWIWVRGHSGHPFQEVAHHLAFDAYKENC